MQVCKRCFRDLSKLSYFHVPGKEPLLTWTVGDVIDRAADVFGDTTAAVYTHQNISKTYAEYKKDVDLLAASLVSLKLPVGSRVAVVASKVYEVAQLLFAASKAGLVMVIKKSCDHKIRDILSLQATRLRRASYPVDLLAPLGECIKLKWDYVEKSQAATRQGQVLHAKPHF
ncbi:hypothetical protein HPB47_022013 [Ixodes persulcatus]|uniref:Uncharacterized protein n=1 Tax=Ixodes persulcatus TaxID=34615 RepID=A0AC60QAY8_IXOPE|nr:hypothetical protein HPB47_022013 [Ixodes persulcatus]